jgi:hypothetical protein
MMHGTKRSQKEAIDLMTGHDKMRTKRMAVLLRIPERTLRRWLLHYKTFGELKCETRRKVLKAKV